jgi:hypothetical protein
MEVDAAKKLLAEADGDEESVFLPPAVLGKLSVDDLSPETSVEVGVRKDGVMHLDWSGRLYRDGNTIAGEADHIWTRKYWYAPIGLNSTSTSFGEPWKSARKHTVMWNSRTTTTTARMCS